MTVETTDVLIVGTGACGSLVAKELATRGFSVVVLEAGKRFNPATDFANTEANAGKIMWIEPRVYTGKDAIVQKAGVGVGGGTLVWLGVAGECGPFAPEQYQLPMPPHRMNWHAQVLARGADSSKAVGGERKVRMDSTCSHR